MIVLAPLHGLVPNEFVAFTNQLYVAPAASDVPGVYVHVPVPAPQPTAVALTLVPISTPAVFCTRK